MKRTAPVAGLVVVTSAAVLAASCVAPANVEIPTHQESPDDVTGLMSIEPGQESVGEGQEPVIAVAALVVVCEVAGVLIAEHICNRANFWPAHCPSGTWRVIKDMPNLPPAWRSNGTRINCDLLQEFVCGVGGYGAGLTFGLFCHG